MTGTFGRSLTACTIAILAAGISTARGDAQSTASPHTHHDMLAAGNRAMGFDQASTFHHFRLLRRGGVIEVHVNDRADTQSAQQITMHLEHISRQFATGDFAASIATHGEPPPGVEVLRRRADKLRYTFEATPVGGRVRIATDDREALGALHAFLRYQIREHGTGDETEVEKR
jgi:hypothetical protein